ncbi:hypothetical protein SDC9_90411 [bioreactor metagenome]|uniref:Uncharacterized protein n=1 Tax=bioreactor metagenome TaxID=1076179 RepID=A0A645A1Q7_9ZZZZ
MNGELLERFFIPADLLNVGCVFPLQLYRNIVNPTGSFIPVIDGIRASGYLTPLLDQGAFQSDWLAINDQPGFHFGGQASDPLTLMIQWFHIKSAGACAVLSKQQPQEGVINGSFAGGIPAGYGSVSASKVQIHALDALEVVDTEVVNHHFHVYAPIKSQQFLGCLLYFLFVTHQCGIESFPL